MDGGDEAVTETLEAVLEGTAQELVDNPDLCEATLDEALALGQPRELVKSIRSLVSALVLE